MDRYDPYYAQDTDGVHFAVDVDGRFVQAYISRRVLALAYGATAPGQDSLDAYLAHCGAIDAAVRRRVRLRGPETVIVQPEELERPDVAGSTIARLFQRTAGR